MLSFVEMVSLEMVSSAYLSVKSIQMDISASNFRKHIFHKVGVFSQGGQMGYPACQ